MCAVLEELRLSPEDIQTTAFCNVYVRFCRMCDQLDMRPPNEPIAIGIGCQLSQCGLLRFGDARKDVLRKVGLGMDSEDMRAVLVDDEAVSKLLNQF